MNRTENAMRNAFFAVLSKILTLAVTFISRTLFIRYLGNTYLGINSLFTEILSTLSFVELGFGTALNFSMYKPVAEKNDEMLLKLLVYYKKIYKIIALLISVIGIGLIPFLQYIVNGAGNTPISEIRTYFLFFLANTVIGYFVSYKYSIVNANQKNYIITNIEFVINFIIVIVQIVTIAMTKNYLMYLIVHTGLLFISRIILAYYLNKKFPILKEKPKQYLSKKEKQPIYKEVKGLVFHQFSSVAIHQTDNIIISSLTDLGVVAVGYISNYNMIINAVTGIITLVFNNFVSSVGNLAAASTKDNFRKVFKDINFLNFWIYGFLAIAFYILIPPFIELWIGEEFLIDKISFLLIILNCYLMGQSIAYNTFRNGYGNFNSDKWISISQALINLVVSIICCKAFGLVGVYMGTIASRIWFVLLRPFVTYEMMFEEGVKEYYKKLFMYLGIVVVAATVTYSITEIFIRQVTTGSFICEIVLVICIPNVLFFIFTFWSKEFKNILQRLKNLLCHNRK